MADTTEASSPTVRASTDLFSKNLTYWILGLMLAGISFAALMSFLEWRRNDGADDFWAELFKTGFLLIGGAFTSIVGYYFGSAGAEEARAQADRAKAEAEKAQLEAKSAHLKEANEISERDGANLISETAPDIIDADLE